MIKKAIAAHRFKKHEWLYLKTKSELVDMIKKYECEFATGYEEAYIEWTEKEIRHFFQINFHIFKGSLPEKHNTRCVITILHELGRTVTYGE